MSRGDSIRQTASIAPLIEPLIEPLLELVLELLLEPLLELGVSVATATDHIML